MFYPEIKAHISPSAFAAWFNQRGSFVKSYFLGEKTKETASMTAGKQIHELIEGHFLEVKHNYEHHEKTLEQYIETADGKFKVLGIPDSYQVRAMTGKHAYVASFVDYKSGKENNWSDVVLAGDLKMKLTAWLVWRECDKPGLVEGFIEYLPTVWNPVSRKIELVEGEDSVVAAKITYTGAEMEAFTEVILKTILEINAAYEEWKESSDEFVSQEDITEYVELDRQRVEIETKQELIKERIADSLTMGKKSTIATLFGTFYFRETKKYVYPGTLPVAYEEDVITLKEAESIAAATSAAKKKFETENTPASVSRSLSFKPKK